MLPGVAVVSLVDGYLNRHSCPYGTVASSNPCRPRPAVGFEGIEGFVSTRPRDYCEAIYNGGLHMTDAIGYLRVSTQEQGRSGLGLAAQRVDIEHFGKREGFSVTAWHQDIQTGAGMDAILLRPGLAAALKAGRAAQCPIIVSRLDRLSRNVHFIAGLMEHKVHFMVAVFGRDVDHFTLHIYASIAEQERRMISERVRAASLIAKSQGRRFGLQLRSKSWQRKVRVFTQTCQK